MRMKVNGGRVDGEVPERRAGPGEARSVAALFLAAGAAPDEIDGAVQVLIEMTQRMNVPQSYAEVAQQPIDAITEYRRRQQGLREAPVVIRNGAPA
jgi:hypothetical protein